jgi:DNA-binding NarL/FixJ family response regulator
MENKLKVMIAGSHLFQYKVGEMLENILPAEAQIRISSGDALLQALQKNSYNVVLVEENTERAAHTIKSIKKIATGTKIILFNDIIKDEIKEADVVLPCKISKRLSKELKKHLLAPSKRTAIKIIEKVAAIAEPEAEPTVLTTVCLTYRKMEVFKWIYDGKTNAEMAKLAFVTERTIEGHRPRLYELINEFSAADIVKFAIRQGWTDKKAQLNTKFTDMMKSGKKRFYISFEMGTKKIKPAKPKRKKKE